MQYARADCDGDEVADDNSHSDTRGETGHKAGAGVQMEEADPASGAEVRGCRR
jgi:hypothetical protein